MVISILTIALSLALANDGASSGPVGGLVLQKEENILMKKETLKISPRKISVDYVFENKSGNDVETFIQFPLPIEIEDIGGRYEDYNPKFSVVVNGKTIQYRTTYKIYNQKDLNKDLTEKLKSEGFLKGDSSKWVKNEDAWSERQKKELIRLGVLDNEGHRQWYSQRVFYWKQKFPANQEIKIHHEYKPLIGGSVPNPDGLKDSCADDSYIFLDNVKKLRNKCFFGGTMKSTILVVALTFSSFSVFAETNDIMCGVVKKVTTHDDGARIEFTDGSIVKNTVLDSRNSPFITASMTSNITICFKEYGMNSIFSASK